MLPVRREGDQHLLEATAKEPPPTTANALRCNGHGLVSEDILTDVARNFGLGRS